MRAGRDVRVQILPREEAFQIPDLIRTKINLLPEGIAEVRTVEIVGLDLQADGGTHVRNTREVGGLRVVGTRSKGKANKRLEIELTDPEDAVTPERSAGRRLMTGTTTWTANAGVSKRIEPFVASVWPWVDQLAERNPEAVFFGGGVPPMEVIPVDRLREGMEHAWADGAETLLYGEVKGYKPLRELIVDRMAMRGATVDAADVLISNGSQQGIDLVARVFVDPGDVVLTEAPTFMDALRVFRSHEAELVGVPVDEEGLQVDALRQILDRLPKRPKFLYTVPTYQNPMGVTMSPARRQALVELARERQIPIVEDDPYGDLAYDGQTVPTLKALDPEVIFLGTFSKILAPGLRVGWVASSPALRESFFNVKEGTDIHNERLMTRAIYHAAIGFLDGHIARTREIYRRAARRDAGRPQRVHACRHDLDRAAGRLLPLADATGGLRYRRHAAGRHGPGRHLPAQHVVLPRPLLVAFDAPELRLAAGGANCGGDAEAGGDDSRTLAAMVQKRGGVIAEFQATGVASAKNPHPNL